MLTDKQIKAIEELTGYKRIKPKMKKPKLPKLVYLKTNPMNGKIIIPLSGTRRIQVDPKYFGFHKKVRYYTSGNIKRHIIVANEYTDNRFAHTAYFKLKDEEAIVSDCLSLAEYSISYQAWGKSKVKPMEVTIECEEDY